MCLKDNYLVMLFDYIVRMGDVDNNWDILDYICKLMFYDCRL